MKQWLGIGAVLAVLTVGWKVVLPRVWSRPASAPIPLDVDPVQTPIDPPERLTVTRDGKTYVIEKQFAYEVHGEVLSASTYDVTWTNDFADVDLGLIWGPRREAMQQRFKFFQMGRWLFWRTPDQPTPDERQEVTTHISNNHLIPADGSRHLEWAFRQLSKGDRVRVKGALVRISDAGGALYAQSSTSRDDIGDGACEVVWVDELQIGERVFR